jgi:acetyl-CoA C-acetyltransferase
VTAGGSYLLGGVRTPFGRFGGGLRDVGAVPLGIAVVLAALDRLGIDPEAVDDVVLGNAVGTDKIVARQVTLLAGLPDTLTSLTINRACCSAMTAVTLADASVRLGRADVVVAGGTESMSGVPHLLRGARWGTRLGPGVLEDPLLLADPTTDSPAAVDAGAVAMEHGVDRPAQDEWALRSQQAYQEALARGFFDGELTAVPGTTLTGDEQPRPDTTLAALERLPTVFGSPTVTAGNAPGLNDGAVAVVVGSAAAAERFGLTPLARIVATAAVAGPSREIATIPGTAIAAVLAAAGWQVDDVDLIEINEAFAAVPPTSVEVLVDRGAKRERLLERTNVNGGAVALGHPVGATGARLVLTLARALRERHLRRGVAAICGGSGQGDAVAVEVDEWTG